MRRILTLVTLFVAITIPALPAAAAGGGGETVEGPSIAIPYQAVFGPEGSRHLLGSVEVPVEQQGLRCAGVVTDENNESENPGNDLIVVSDGSSVPILDVEGEGTENGVHTTVGTLVLGSTVEVWVKLGPNERYSGGSMVATECELPPKPVPVPWSEVTCDTETGESMVPLENRGETPFDGAILDGDGRTVAADSELVKDGEPLRYFFLPGESWTVTVNGEVFKSGEAVDCKVLPPETTTTTTAPPPTTTLPPSQGDIAEPVDTGPFASWGTGELVLALVVLGLASLIAFLAVKNGRHGRRELLA